MVLGIFGVGRGVGQYNIVQKYTSLLNVHNMLWSIMWTR